MAWFGKKDKSKDKQAAEGSDLKIPAGQNAKGTPDKGSGKSQRQGEGKTNSADLRAQALAHARTARETIGEETLQRVAAAIRKKQQNPVEQAKAKIAESDAERVAEEILSMLETRH